MFDCAWFGNHLVFVMQSVVLAEPNCFVVLWPQRLHIPGRLVNDRWADSVQGTFGLIDSSAPEGPIICHPPRDVSVQPATAALPQLWIIGHVRRPQTTLSTPMLLPNALWDFLLSFSLLHNTPTHIYLHICAHIYTCAHMYTHRHVALDCNESPHCSWEFCLSRYVFGRQCLADHALFSTNHNIISGSKHCSIPFEELR